MTSSGVNYRRATKDDIFPLLHLYQLSFEGEPTDPILSNAKKLSNDLQSPQSLWIVGEKNSRVVAGIYFWIDPPSGLSKIGRLLLDPEWKESDIVLKESLPLLTEYLGKKGIEVIYTTTKSITILQQERTLQMGFKALGIFPNAVDCGPLKMNGLSAYYQEGVLKKRFSDFKLHADLAGIYEPVQKACNLPEAILVRPPKSQSEFVPLPALEFIHAPRFVEHRYEQLKRKHAISVDFYPFHQPNALITDPQQKAEIFLKVVSEGRFAAIIGERLDLAVNPAEMYEAVSFVLNQRNINFIEIINDAADPQGIECILQAGFIPCAYFPCFKKQGTTRRDYVVFSKTFERLVGPSFGKGALVPESYLNFVKEYYRLDEQYQLGKRSLEAV